MVLDVGWDAVTGIVGWAESAYRAAKTKAERRVANVVEHAGVLVAGVNRLNAQVIQLIKPLVYFDPVEWDAESRGALVRDLVLFAEESAVVPRMRAARDALRALIPDLSDVDISGPAIEILNIADSLFYKSDQLEKRPAAGDAFSSTREEWRAFENTAGPSPILDVAGGHVYGPDSALSAALPSLVRAIRRADSPEDVESLRHFARALTNRRTAASSGTW